MYLLKSSGIPSVLNLSIDRNKIVKEVLGRKIYDCIRYFIYLNILIRREMTTANFVDFSFIKCNLSLKQVVFKPLNKRTLSWSKHGLFCAVHDCILHSIYDLFNVW